jgi:hypothetical protein
MAYSIAVGVFDWVNFATDQSFYPDDIPDEWKLGYYSNEFNTLCMGVEVFFQNQDVWAEWVDNLPESFDLALYLEHNDQTPIILELLQTQGSRVSTLICGGPAGNNLLQKETLTKLLSAQGKPLSISVYAQQEIWTPQNHAANGASVALFPAIESLRSCRQWIQQWLSDALVDDSDRHRTLWLQGAQTSYQQLTEVRTMVELMGY